MLTASVLVFFKYRNCKNEGNEEQNYEGRLFAFSSFYSICAVVGYIINSKVLAQKFSFVNYTNIKYVSITSDAIMKIINGWLNSLGYRAEEKIFSFATIYNMLSIGLCFLVIAIVFDIIKNRKEYELEQQVVIIFFIMAFLVFCALYLVTNTSYSDRYNIPIVVFIFPVIFCYLKRIKIENKWKEIAVGICCFVLAVCCCFTYRDEMAIDDTKEKREIAQFLVDKGYQEGYATWGNGNVIVELSDGKIDIRHWGIVEDVEDINKLYKWLQSKEHDTILPKGRVCIILAQSEKEKFTIAKQLDEEAIIYETEKFVIYGYEEYSLLEKDIEIVSTE